MFSQSELTEGQIDEKVNAIIQDFKVNTTFRFESEAKSLGANVVVKALLKKGLIKVSMEAPAQSMFTPKQKTGPQNTILKREESKNSSDDLNLNTSDK